MRRSLIPNNLFANSAPAAGTRAVLEGFFRGDAQASTLLHLADRTAMPCSTPSRHS